VRAGLLDSSCPGSFAIGEVNDFIEEPRQIFLRSDAGGFLSVRGGLTVSLRRCPRLRPNPSIRHLARANKLSGAAESLPRGAAQKRRVGMFLHVIQAKLGTSPFHTSQPIKSRRVLLVTWGTSTTTSLFFCFFFVFYRERWEATIHDPRARQGNVKRGPVGVAHHLGQWCRELAGFKALGEGNGHCNGSQRQRTERLNTRSERLRFTLHTTGLTVRVKAVERYEYDLSRSGRNR